MSAIENTHATAAKEITIVKATPQTQELIRQSFKGQH